MQEPARQRALVLLGNSGVGKDTLAALLAQENPVRKTFNAKFSAFAKGLVADALQVPVSRWEDKNWRNTRIYGSLTPLDLLQVLYFGSLGDSNPSYRFQQACLSYISNRIYVQKPDLVVFTDLRKPEEVNWLCRQEWLVTWVLVRREGCHVKECDHEIATVLRMLPGDPLYLDSSATDTPVTTYKRLQTLLQKAEANGYPGIH